MGKTSHRVLTTPFANAYKTMKNLDKCANIGKFIFFAYDELWGRLRNVFSQRLLQMHKKQWRTTQIATFDIHTYNSFSKCNCSECAIETKTIKPTMPKHAESGRETHV